MINARFGGSEMSRSSHLETKSLFTLVLPLFCLVRLLLQNAMFERAKLELEHDGNGANTTFFSHKTWLPSKILDKKSDSTLLVLAGSEKVRRVPRMFSVKPGARGPGPGPGSRVPRPWALGPGAGARVASPQCLGVGAKAKDERWHFLPKCAQYNLPKLMHTRGSCSPSKRAQSCGQEGAHCTRGPNPKNNAPCHGAEDHLELGLEWNVCKF